MKKRSTVATVHSIKDGKALVAPKGKREYVLLAPEMSDRLNRDVELLMADGACTKIDYARLGFRYGVSWRTVQNRVGRLRSSRGAQAGQNQRHTHSSARTGKSKPCGRRHVTQENTLGLCPRFTAKSKPPTAQEPFEE